MRASGAHEACTDRTGRGGERGGLKGKWTVYNRSASHGGGCVRVRVHVGGSTHTCRHCALIGSRAPASPQGLPEAAAAAERAAGDAAELRRLPQAEALAVVAALHQGEGARGGGLVREGTGPKSPAAWARDCLCPGRSFPPL